MRRAQAGCNAARAGRIRCRRRPAAGAMLARRRQWRLSRSRPAAEPVCTFAACPLPAAPRVAATAGAGPLVGRFCNVIWAISFCGHRRSPPISGSFLNMRIERWWPHWKKALYIGIKRIMLGPHMRPMSGLNIPVWRSQLPAGESPADTLAPAINRGCPSCLHWFLTWVACRIHPCRSWSPPGIVFKMTWRLVEIWKSFNHNST